MSDGTQMTGGSQPDEERQHPQDPAEGGEVEERPSTSPMEPTERPSTTPMEGQGAELDETFGDGDRDGD